MKRALLLLFCCIAVLLTGCETTPAQATHDGEVVKTTTFKDGRVEKLENKSNYGAYVDARLREQESNKVKITCPPDGCRFASLEIPLGVGASGSAIKAYEAPESTGTAVVKGFFSLGSSLLDRAFGAVPWIAGWKVLDKAFDAASGKSNNYNYNDSSNRSVTTTTDNSNRSVNTDNSNRSVNTDNSRRPQCNTGTATGGATTPAASGTNNCGG